MNVLEHLRQLFATALEPLTDRPTEYSRHVRPAQEARFGDYQANCAMPLRAELGGNPRQIAQQLVDALPDRWIFSSIEIAGPGFVNLRLTDAFLTDRLSALFGDDRLGIPTLSAPKTMVVDYSSPNVAKPMHVGHLRSTIIGDALARIHRELGWTVHSDNHLGDWGTQFGMLIYGWRQLRDKRLAEQNPLQELARLYKLVNSQAEQDPQLANAVRAETAKLHNGDFDNLELWKRFIPWCLADLSRIYDRLDIRFDYQLGESYYQPMLADTVAKLLAAGIAEESDGAICVFFPDASGKTDENGKPVQRMAPTIVQKADGAFTYATSDLACIRYRLEQWTPDVIVYVVDDRQSLHFQQIFEIAHLTGHQNVELVHVAFGKITGKDGKPYKTREGGTVGLEALLDEAVTRARAVVDEASPDLSQSERQAIAEVVGIGAVKYADLCQNRLSDYVFDWDKMITLNGNTATYLQYVYARNRSIFRKGEVDPAALASSNPSITVTHPCERALAMSLLRYPESLEQAARDYRPNILTNYLFELANSYNSFFRDCPVLKAPSESMRASRLALCELTARTIKHGLWLLGIQTVERM